MSFRDRDLEQRYRNGLVESSRERMRSATVSGVILWLVGGVITHVFVGVDPAVAYPLTVGVALINLIGFLAARQSESYDQLQIVGALVNSIAILAFFWFAAYAELFDTYAALGAMLIATFSFVVIHLRFVVSAVLVAVYVPVFVLMSIVSGSSATLAQTFLLSAALVMGLIGVRSLENAARTGFLQRVEIEALNDEVERLLRTYLSPRVAERMLADSTVADLGGVVTSVSVLFADLEGFTPMSRAMDPGDVASVLNRYFEVVVPTVIAEGGAVLSFGGDAILAVFNAPDPQPDHALRATRSALRIQEEIGRLRSEQGLGKAPLFRIGVNTGEAFVGNVGSDETRTFTVIGDAVNLAARLQTQAMPGTVLIGPDTYLATAGHIEAEQLPEVTLKGLDGPIQPYRLISMV